MPATVEEGTRAHLQADAAGKLRLPSHRTLVEWADQLTIHKGKISTVWSARDPTTQRCYVIKGYDKAALQPRHYSMVQREVHLLRLFSEYQCRWIVQLLSTYEDEDRVYLVFSACLRGDLFQLLTKHKTLPETYVAGQVVAPLLSTLEHLHSLNIVHRDIKPENILITLSGEIQLADFGLAAHKLYDKLTERVGTLDYLAPEVLAMPTPDEAAAGKRGAHHLPYNEKVDVWGVGVLCYELLTGRPPFEVPDAKETARLILSGRVDSWPAHLSPECRDFIEQCLCVKPALRPSAAELLEHPWIRAHADVPQHACSAPMARTLKQMINETWYVTALHSAVESLASSQRASQSASPDGSSGSSGQAATAGSYSASSSAGPCSPMRYGLPPRTGGGCCGGCSGGDPSTTPASPPTPHHHQQQQHQLGPHPASGCSGDGCEGVAAEAGPSTPHEDGEGEEADAGGAGAAFKRVNSALSQLWPLLMPRSPRKALSTGDDPSMFDKEAPPLPPRRASPPNQPTQAQQQQQAQEQQQQQQQQQQQALQQQEQQAQQLPLHHQLQFLRSTFGPASHPIAASSCASVIGSGFDSDEEASCREEEFLECGSHYSSCAASSFPSGTAIMPSVSAAGPSGGSSGAAAASGAAALAAAGAGAATPAAPTSPLSAGSAHSGSRLLRTHTTMPLRQQAHRRNSSSVLETLALTPLHGCSRANTPSAADSGAASPERRSSGAGASAAGASAAHVPVVPPPLPLRGHELVGSWTCSAAAAEPRASAAAQRWLPAVRPASSPNAFFSLLDAAAAPVGPDASKGLALEAGCAAVAVEGEGGGLSALGGVPRCHSCMPMSATGGFGHSPLLHAYNSCGQLQQDGSSGGGSGSGGSSGGSASSWGGGIEAASSPAYSRSVTICKKAGVGKSRFAQ